MKQLLVVGMILAVLLCVARANEGKFTSSVTPEDLAATGLDGLTPAQLTRLNALIEAYKSGALATARRAAAEAVAAQQAAEAQTARAEAKAEAAKADAARAEAANLSQPAPNLLAKARGLLKPSVRTETVVTESSLPGKFRGWDGHQIFTLANGQRWQVAGNDSYYNPAIENPRVQIVPSSLAGFWLRFPDLDVQVRVNFLGDN